MGFHLELGMKKGAVKSLLESARKLFQHMKLNLMKWLLLLLLFFDQKKKVVSSDPVYPIQIRSAGLLGQKGVCVKCLGDSARK